MSTNCPDRILVTSFWGKGSVAGDRENAAVAVGSGGEVTRVCIEGGMPAPKVDGERDQTVTKLIGRGVAQSTLTAYNSGKTRYLAFCTQYNFAPLPVTEPQLLHFVAFLFHSSLSY